MCGSDVIEAQDGYICINNKFGNGNCRFHINKQINDYELTEEDIKSILDNGYTEQHIVNIEEDHYLVVQYKLDERNNLIQEKIRKVIGKCPLCGGDFCESSKSYYCENKKKDGSGICNAWIPKTLGGYTLSDLDVEMLLAGQPTEKHLVLFKDGTIRSISFILGGERGCDILSDNQNHSKDIIGNCPICGKYVYAADNNYYYGSCDWSFPKRIKGAIIDKDNMFLMLQGKQTEPIKFKWKNGHEGYACLYLEKDELKWLFMDSDYY